MVGNIRQRSTTSTTRSHRAFSSLSIVASDIPHTTPSKSADEEYKLRIRRQKYDDLLDSVSRDRPNPSRAWGHYVDLLNFLALEKLPLELHQLVLRKCVPPASVLRMATSWRAQGGVNSKVPHMYESRLRAVINNIRAAGWKPTIDDYHFVLSQFAAVGHHIGAARVLDEMERIGVEPRTKTYGICLQAIAHRLCLPCPQWKRDQVLDECVQFSMRVLEGIRNRGIPITSVNLDLAMRIIKEAGRPDAFEALLRIGYGIDLSFPDHLPIESKQEGAAIEVGGPWKGPIVNRQPLTTAMLTTIVDFYGQNKQLSRMVQLFEVLSNPLPSPREDQSAFDDDEDDFSPYAAITGEHSLPSAKPNITTFNTTIRHCAKAKHDVLARHYLLQAIDTDLKQSERIKEDLASKPASECTPPTVLVNQKTLIPIVGLANRNKDRELMKWVMGQNRRIWRQKRKDLAFCRAVLENQGETVPVDDQEPMVDPDADPSDVLETEKPVSGDVNFFTPSSPSPQPLAPNMKIHPLDLDPASLDAPVQIDSESNMPQKLFDLQLHAVILRRDIVGLAELDKTIGTSMTRICDRTKEKLGRRVWAEKDVFVSRVPGGEPIAKGNATRVKLSRDTWKKIVNFGGGQSDAVSTVEQGTPEVTPSNVDKKAL